MGPHREDDKNHRPGRGGPCRGKAGGFTFTRGPAVHPQDVRCSPAGDGAPLGRWHLDLWFWKVILTAMGRREKEQSKAFKAGGSGSSREAVKGSRKEQIQLWSWAVAVEMKRERKIPGLSALRTAWTRGGGQGPSFLSDFPLWLPDVITLKRSN